MLNIHSGNKMPQISEIIYGINPVRECLRAGRRKIKKIFQARRKESTPFREIVRLAAQKGVLIKQVDRDRIQRISGGGDHQGIAAEVEPFPYSDLEEVIRVGGERPSVLLVLDGILDPHNLGAIVRTAAVCGLKWVLIPRKRSTSINATVAKVSAGAVEYLRVCRVTNLAAALDRLKKAGYWIVGIDENAELPIFRFRWDTDTAVVIGGEHKGIRPLVRRKCDVELSIPVEGPLKTLNASVAGGIVIYEVMRKKMLDKFLLKE